MSDFLILLQRGPSNPIYPFYEELSQNTNGNEGNTNNKFYKCHHGQCKILTITKAMQSIKLPAIGLIGHIKAHFPTMYRLYLVLKGRTEPPTNDEIAIASGKKPLDPAKAAEYFVKLEKATVTLVDVFTQQNQKAAVHTCSFPF
jgi:hypothetical protein